MKNFKISIYLIAASLLVCLPLNAQVDSRNRTPETVISDGLAQLPTKTVATYNQVMSEMSGTGLQGMTLLTDMLESAKVGETAPFEYAINGIVGYVSASDKVNLRGPVKQGLIQAIEKSKDNAKRAFLMLQLQRISDAKDASVFVKYLSDKYMHQYALSSLATTPGTEAIIKDLIAKSTVPDGALAYLAYVKKLKDPNVEQTFLKWSASADSMTAQNIYNALTVCGSSKSLNLLGTLAARCNYADNATGVTNAYLELLNNAQDRKTVAKAAKVLVKNDKSYVRCAGLRLLLKSDAAHAKKYILAALKDGDIAYRNTALDFAKQYVGGKIFDAVASKYSKYSERSKTDIIRWLGNNHVEGKMNLMTGAMKSSDSVLACAAIEAAAKIGGKEALQALIDQLSGAYSKQANKALLTFKGNIKEGITNALSNSDSSIVIQALKLASTRHMYSTYAKVKELMHSNNAMISDAAYEALKGVSTPEKFGEICSLLNASQEDKVAKIQEGAKNAIASLSAGKQYEAIKAQMDKSPKPSRYYPLLAQASNSQAIKLLLSEYEKDNTDLTAYKSLLSVNNPSIVPSLYRIASKESNKKDEILSRCIDLIKTSSDNQEQKYLLYRQAMGLKPSVKIQNKLLNALGNTKSLQALMFVGKYLSKNETSSAAANAVKNLIAKNSNALRIISAKQQLEQAKTVFQAQKEKGSADAGYAVDEISGLMPKFKSDGYRQIIKNVEGTKVPVELMKQTGNFEMFVDWRVKDGTAALNYGGVTLAELSKNSVIISGMTSKQTTKKPTIRPNWNTLYLKVANGRLTLISNGETLAENYGIDNLSGATPGSTIEFQTRQGTVYVRDAYVYEHPATPEYQLTTEERKAGFEVLFGGRSLDKWEGNVKDYVPQEDGSMLVNAKYGNDRNLYTKRQYSDFIYRFEFCFLEPGVNNGVGIRTHQGTDAAYDGMEIQVLDHDDPIYKGLRDYQQHGAVYGIIVPKHVKFGKLGTWNTEEIVAKGDHIKVTVNGEVILDGNIREACQGHNIAPDGSKNNPYTVDHKNHPGLFNKQGYISFCGHGAGVKFRNVRILDLSKATQAPNKRRK